MHGSMYLLYGATKRGHYEQFVIIQKKEDRISKRKKKGKGQTTLAMEYPNVFRNRFILSTNRFIQTKGYFDRGTTSVDTPSQR